MDGTAAHARNVGWTAACDDVCDTPRAELQRNAVTAPPAAVAAPPSLARRVVAPGCSDGGCGANGAPCRCRRCCCANACRDLDRAVAVAMRRVHVRKPRARARVRDVREPLLPRPAASIAVRTITARGGGSGGGGSHRSGRRGARVGVGWCVTAAVAAAAVAAVVRSSRKYKYRYKKKEYTCDTGRTRTHNEVKRTSQWLW